MSIKASHSKIINSLGYKETNVSVSMSAKGYETCTPLLEQLLHAKRIDSHVYDKTTSTVHSSRSTKVSKEKRLEDVYLEKVLEIPMSGDDYDTCTTGTGLLRQIMFAGLINAFFYEEGTAYLSYTIRVGPAEGNLLQGSGEDEQAEEFERVQ